MKTKINVLFFCVISIFFGFATSSRGEDDAVGKIIADAKKQAEVKQVLKVDEMVICKNVVDRKPVDPAGSFTVDVGQIYCFTKVLGAMRDTGITHNWYYKDKLTASVPLYVGSWHWRTYSIKTIKPEDRGEWRVEVTSEDGDVLDQIRFVIE